MGLLAIAASAFGAFPQDPPNDPLYDRAEENPLQFCIDDEQYLLYDFMPRCTPAATDPEGASGMSLNRAWSEFSTGRHDTVIAYVEAGVNWHGRDIEELRNKVYLNRGELPPPTTEDGDPALRASDYSDTSDANGNSVVDPEDIIVRFSNRRDEDRNGYTDDISGWDFYNDQNDPATNDSAYEHANSQMKNAAAETDNGLAQAGVCPRCRLLPIKAGAEALDRTDDLAEAWLYAVDAGSSVVVSVTADLGYSTHMREAAEYVAHHGAVAVEASNDFNSTDHQGGMWHPHVLPGNGVVADRLGFDQGARLTRTYRERSSITSWGAHNMFSVPTRSGTTSAATPTLGGTVALVMAYSRQAAEEGRIARPLTGLEAVQVLRATASDIDDPSLAWPNRPGWDLQFGYGRPNAWKAMKAVSEGRVPPIGTIESPGWFSLADPTRQRSVPVRGRIAAARPGRYTWRLEVGLGAEPADSEFRTVRTGSGTRPYEGTLGEIDLRRIPRSFWARRFELSRRKELETTERYTVTLRLRVTDSAGELGEERRAIFAHHDDSALPGFPKRIGPGGDAQSALVDLTGAGRLHIVFGDTDGRVHAIDSRTGRELRGWPVRTDRTRVTKEHEGVDPRSEPVISNVAVADLDGTGSMSVIASTTSGKLYVWGADGRRRRGFPKALDRGVSAPPIPRPDLEYTRLPARGAFAAPVVGDLDGDRRPEIIQAAWDGHLHAFRRDGRELPGWPIKVQLPPEIGSGPGRLRVNDHKLQGTPALADLDGDGRLEVVQRSQYTDITEGEFSPGASGYLHAYRADGRPVPGWPATMPTAVEAYGTAQEFITEGTNSPAAADVDGDGDDEIASNPVFSPSYLFDGDGSLRATYGPAASIATDAFFAPELNPSRTLDGGLPADVAVGFTTSGAFGRFAGGLSYVQPGSAIGSVGATIALPGLGTPIVNLERAFDARGGGSRPGFPAKLQGLNFVGAPLIVDVTGDGEAEAVDGADSNAIHGFAAGGGQSAGFPKFMTGWTLWSPSAGDLDTDGRTDLVSLTREGYLFAWRTTGRAESNVEWWRWHHDEHSSGRYGVDTRPPGAPRSVRLRGTRAVTFLAPGDDWYTGRAATYRVAFFGPPGGRLRTAAVRAAGSGKNESVLIPRGARSVRIQAVDDAGNLGRAVTVQVRPPLRPRTRPRGRPRGGRRPSFTG